MFSNHACCCLFQMFASNMHQNEWFQVRFFKNFLGRGSPSPLPRPLPPFFLGLRPRFGFRPQFSGASRLRIGLRPRFSGASRPRFGLRPQLSVENLVWPPQNKFLDPPLKEGKCLTWDVTVADTFAATYVAATSIKAGEAAARLVANKREKYDELTHTHLFCPIAVETMGPVEEEGRDLLSAIGHQICKSLVTPERPHSSFRDSL